MFVRNPYNYDRDAASVASGLSCPELPFGRTQQQFAEECDINTIVRRFGLTGQLPPGGVEVPLQGDFTSIVDYQTALNMVIAADEAFLELPAELRKRFGNDPQQLLEFVSDDSNRDEAQRLGIVPTPTPVDPPPSPPAPLPA